MLLYIFSCRTEQWWQCEPSWSIVHFCKKHQPCPKMVQSEVSQWETGFKSKDLEGLSYFVYWPAASEKKTLFSLLFWCSEEHAFSASSEFRRDFRWVARPHSLITRSKTPAELHAAPRGIKPPPAVASSGPTCQDTINSYCWQIWTVPMVQLSSLTLIFCPYLHNVNLVCNGL